MRPPIRAAAAAAAVTVALLVASAVVAQRTSPQFSFPPPGTLASQFGADVFTANNQDLNVLSQSSPASQGAPNTLVQIGNAPVSGSSSELGISNQPQLVAAQLPPQRPPQAQEQMQPQQQQQPQQSPPQQAAPIQLSRPSLSVTSLTSITSQQQQNSARQQTAPKESQQPARANHRSSQSQHHATAVTAPAAPTPAQSSPSHRQQQQQQQQQNHHHHNQQSQQHPSNLQTQQTSQSLNAGSNQAAIEAARKAEATAASLAAASGQTYHCPDSFGFFRHHKSCDKYWACENGTSTLKLCGNGLMFDDSDPKRENCAYPFSVDCGADRTDLEPPISTPHCPRLYGLFSDSANCRIFYSCWNGESSRYECPPGLAYDSEQRVCVWADTVDRCDQSEVSDGFVCPDPTEVDQPGHYTRHAHPTDCRKFYVCIEGVARPYGCSFGSVFNVDSLQCDEPENVGGCEKYYGELDPKLAKKLARENTQGAGQQGPATNSRSSSTSSSSSSSSAGSTSAGKA